MILKKLVPFAAFLLCVIMAAAPAHATSFTFTDINDQLGSRITYNLDYSQTSGTTYTGTLTVTSSGNTHGWYADSILFKPENGSSLASFKLDAGPSASWIKSSANGGFYGFSVLGRPLNYTYGIDLSNTNPVTFNFQFSLKPGKTLNDLDPSLKVEYYNWNLPIQGHFDRLSAEFQPSTTAVPEPSTSAVPEPSTLLFLGAGVLGLAVCRKGLKKA